MSNLVSYKACFFCKEPFLDARLNTHLNNNHLDQLQVLADATGKTLADQTSWALEHSEATDNAPVPNVALIPSSHVVQSVFVDYGVTPDQLKTAVVKTTGSGNKIQQWEIVDCVGHLSSTYGIEIDKMSFYLSLCVVLVNTQASERTSDLGTFSLFTVPAAVPGSASANAVRTAIHDKDWQEVLDEMKQYFTDHSRPDITVRNIGTAMYPFLYNARKNKAFSQFWKYGTPATTAMGVSPSEWPYLLSFAIPGMMKESQKALFAQWVRSLVPVDAVVDPIRHTVDLPSVQNSLSRAKLAKPESLPGPPSYSPRS